MATKFQSSWYAVALIALSAIAIAGWWPREKPETSFTLVWDESVKQHPNVAKFVAIAKDQPLNNNDIAELSRLIVRGEKHHTFRDALRLATEIHLSKDQAYFRFENKRLPKDEGYMVLGVPVDLNRGVISDIHCVVAVH